MTIVKFLVTAHADHNITVQTFGLLDQQLIGEYAIGAGEDREIELSEGMVVTLAAGTMPATEMVHAVATPIGEDPMVVTLFDRSNFSKLAESLLPLRVEHIFAMSDGLAIGVRAGTIDYAAIEAAERVAEIGD